MTAIRGWYWLAAFLGGGWVLYLLAPVLTPFLVGALFAYLGNPFVDRLEALRVSRTLAVVIVFVSMLLAASVLLLILLPLLQQQLVALANRLPQAIDWMQNTALPWFQSTFGISPRAVDMESLRNALRENWRDVGNVLGLVLQKVGQSGQILLTWFAYILLVPVVTFYLLRDWNRVVQGVRILLPRHVEPTVTRLARECDEVLGQFLRGQLLVMLSLGIIYSLGLWIAGLEFSLLIGMGAGVVSFVPYLGPILGLTTAGIVAAIQYHDLLHLVYVGIVFGIGQMLEGLVLSPWLVGERIGLHPVAVIFAVLAGGQLFGFFGVLLALPAAAVVTVLIRFLHARYVQSGFYAP